MADYTETWKEWEREQDRKQCTCPICGEYREDDYCSESCCLECANDYMAILEDVASLVPINVRARIVEELTEDENLLLWEWCDNNTEFSKEEIVDLLNEVDNITSTQVRKYWKKKWSEKNG